MVFRCGLQPKLALEVENDLAGRLGPDARNAFERGDIALFNGAE